MSKLTFTLNTNDIRAAITEWLRLHHGLEADQKMSWAVEDKKDGWKVVVPLHAVNKPLFEGPHR